MSKRKEDFKKASDDYVNGEPDGAQKIIGQVGFEFGAEYGYQYAKKRIGEILLCIELSNFFPTLDENEEIAKGRKKLIDFVNNTLEEL